MTTPHDELQRLGDSVRQRFQAEKRVLSFEEFLELFFEHPWRHSRDAARYVRDCFDHFGTYEQSYPWGNVRRWSLFDLEFESDADRRRDYLVGQERLQESFYRILSNFVREGRANRLALMHGPNGSAKSTFASCVMKGLEHYSTTDEGALYRFSWIFPRGSDGKVIGFGSDEVPLDSYGSYAHLDESRVESKLTSELREHPLLLLPRDERRVLLRRIYEDAGLEESPPGWLWNGQLGQKNRDIFSALLTAYSGDLAKVLAHVQVERYYISKRYRTGAVTIGPQMAVDARERQVTADRSLGALPASLSALNLFETVGELVDGQGGVIEYSDLLTRPLDAWRYLLLAIETGDVALQMSILPVNSVLLASSNELHLNAFREHHEYKSFRGRLQLLRAPYLLDYHQEQRIYDDQIVPQVPRHVAPHATQMAALWGVLTRLLKPDVEHYEDPALGRLAEDLAPMEKARLYAEGEIPERLASDQMKLLRAGMGHVVREFDGTGVYEGLTGASPRVLRALLLDAAQSPNFGCLSPLAVLEGIESICAQEDYDFLKQQPDGGYHDHRGFVQQVQRRWLDLVDDEVRTCTGLVEETQYRELFERYVTHVSLWVKGERYTNPLTGEREDPDHRLMENIEEILDIDEPEEFRRDLINSVAAHAIDHPGEKVQYADVFPRYVDKVKESYFSRRRKHLAEIVRGMLAILAGNDDAVDVSLRKETHNALERFRNELGYCTHCARDALGELLNERYAA